MENTESGLKMNLSELLNNKSIDPKHVLVFRHRPHERELNKVFPWLAAEKPNVFNAYQQTHDAKLEKVMQGMSGHGYVASFIGHEPGKAVFVGLYEIGASKPLSYEEYWNVPAYVEMKAFGMVGFTETESRKSILWFDLLLSDFYADWKGKLIIGWPPPERSWWRYSDRNKMPITAILEHGALDAAMPEWNEMTLTFKDLNVLPKSWKSALSEWRGIYYIFDKSDGKGYVGSACGNENLYGRWRSYSSHGHGGNRLLRGRDPVNFHFSILQRVSPDMESRDLVEIESSWKERLHTRAPFGLNEN